MGGGGGGGGGGKDEKVEILILAKLSVGACSPSLVALKLTK